MNERDISVQDCDLYFRSISTRIPLKFGPETTTQVLCARASLKVSLADGRVALGWGETPLSVAWVWPSDLGYRERQDRLRRFCLTLRDGWRRNTGRGHALEVGHSFIREDLERLWLQANEGLEERLRMPWLAALACASPFDIALHDAYGILHGVNTWDSYTAEYLNHDLSAYYAPDFAARFAGTFPADFLVPASEAPTELRVWHLVGAKDSVEPSELTGGEPDDGYPVLLSDWIRRDGLKCLKVKLSGVDSEWDYGRLAAVGSIAVDGGVEWLSADFNCTVTDPEYVCAILDRLMRDDPRLYGMLLYVEQPFPYDIERFPIDVRALSARKPLFMDESAHDWRLVALGRSLGWSGVALKTCKTLTGALLSLCWAKSFGMALMVQDLTNPMLAQIPHVGLAARTGTVMGVESNAMQFYPLVSRTEARIHPGLYDRKDGVLRLDTLGAVGLGYRFEEIEAARVAAGESDKWEKA